jgi:hypothetical protein
MSTRTLPVDQPPTPRLAFRGAYLGDIGTKVPLGLAQSVLGASAAPSPRSRLNAIDLCGTLGAL